MNSKRSITILASITIAVALLSPLFFQPFFSANALTYTEDNVTAQGVLASDSYVLFPYLKKDLTIGFSKYGEMIDGSTKTGMLYDGYDCFAPHSGVAEWQWIEGWLLNITYEEGGDFRNLWAFALYSDYYNQSSIGGNWKEGVIGGSENIAYLGGRKTNGGATTEPIKVLYDGPRRLILLLNTTVYDAPDHNYAIVSVIFTIIFNKDKKQVIILKDIKRIDEGKNIGEMQIEFGDRGEWDLGAGAPPKSYAHVYIDQETVYDHDYQPWYNTTYDNYDGTYDVAQIIDDESRFAGYIAYWPKPIGMWVGSTQYEAKRNIILSSITTEHELRAGNGTAAYEIRNYAPTPYPQNITGQGVVWTDIPMVFVNNDYQQHTGTYPDYTWNSATRTVTFLNQPYPSSSDTIRFVYKHNVTKVDMSSEPNSPFVIGEWAFKMDQAFEQFRGVTIYGVTDRNNGDDADRTGGSNIIDREIQYYLDETFNPFDLYSAVHKKDYRWVDIRDLTSATTNITLTDGLDDEIWQNKTDLTWDGYKLESGTYDTAEWVNYFEDGYSAHGCNWAARLYANNTSGRQGDAYARVRITPTDFGQNGTYRFGNLTEISFWYYKNAGNATYGPHIFVKLSNGTTGSWVNVQMYNNVVPSPSGWVKVDLSNIAAYTGLTADQAFWYDSDTWTKGANGPLNGVSSGAGVAYHSFDFYKNKLANYYVTDIVVEVGWNLPSTTYGDYLVDDIDVGYLTEKDGIRHERVYNMEEDKLVPSAWDQYCTFAERVLVNGTLIPRYGYHNTTAHQSYYRINFETGNLTFYHWVTSAYTLWTLGVNTHIKVLYSTIEKNCKGRYEWLTVGKGVSIDSLAAAYVTEAFDSTKDIAVAKLGLDIKEAAYGPNAPYVMSGPGTGTRTDYIDSIGRPHLRDDWCTTWPVASSDMISVGGPRANLLTEYFNEFTSAFFARGEMVMNDTGHANKILALSCWNRYTYASNSTHGYALISVYKDLNATIGFLLWGYDGQDGFYAAEWFWSYPAGITCPDGAIVYSGIEYLQHENRGVTSIILQIDYSLDSDHPTITIANNERLGVISEKGWHDP